MGDRKARERRRKKTWYATWKSTVPESNWERRAWGTAGWLRWQMVWWKSSLEVCCPSLPHWYPTVTAIRKAALCKGCPCTAALASGLPHPYSTLCNLFYKLGNRPISSMALSPRSRWDRYHCPTWGSTPRSWPWITDSAGGRQSPVSRLGRVTSCQKYFCGQCYWCLTPTKPSSQKKHDLFNPKNYGVSTTTLHPRTSLSGALQALGVSNIKWEISKAQTSKRQDCCLLPSAPVFRCSF